MIRHMTNLSIANTAVFLAIASLHALRLAFQLPVRVAGHEVEGWVSIAAVIGALVLAALNWRAIHSPGKTEWLKLLLALLIVDAVLAFYSWKAGLSYWGLEAKAFAWWLLFDLVAIAVLFWGIRRKKN